MNQNLDNEIVPVSSPTQAMEEFVGEQFTEWLLNHVVNEVRSFKTFQDLKSAQPKVEKLRKFMLQRYLAAEAFTGGKDGEPGFLGFAIGNLSESADPEAESALSILEKKREEEFEGLSTNRGIKKDFHKELWMRLLKALGCTDEEISHAEPKEWTRNYIAELSDLYSNGEWQEVAGAFAAHERSIPEENKVLIAVIKNNTQLTDHDLEALSWHAGVDHKYVLNTSHILEKVVFDKENKALVWQGANRELEVRKEFLSELVKHLEV
jgi:hypothetical protein